MKHRPIKTKTNRNEKLLLLIDVDLFIDIINFFLTNLLLYIIRRLFFRYLIFFQKPRLQITANEKKLLTEKLSYTMRFRNFH